MTVDDGAGIRARGAFTLVELLVVIIIIAILAGMMLGGISVMRTMIQKAQNQHLVGTIRLGLAQAEVEFSPVPHALASTAAHTDVFGNGTAVTRSLFYRAGSSLDTTGEALVVADLAWLDSDQERALQPDDRFAGYRAPGDEPSFFGLPRRMMQTVGASAVWIDSYRNLPGEGSVYLTAGKLRTPYDSTVYADADFLQESYLAEGTTFEGRSRTAVERALGAVLADLSKLQALRDSGAPDTSAVLRRTDTVTTQIHPSAPTYTSSVTRTIDVATPTTGTFDAMHRLWFPGGADSAVDEWEAGRLWDGGLWTRYQPRGTSLVDRYGCEILVWRDAAGKLIVTSAGPDGSFLVLPGTNEVIDTAPSTFDGTAATLGGDDALADEDNQGTIDG